MGLDALNQLVAQAQVDDLADMVDPEFHAPPEFFNNLESDADYVNDRTLATWMAAMHPSSQIDSEREWISSPCYKLQLIEQGMAIGDLRRPAGGHGDEPVGGAGL